MRLTVINFFKQKWPGSMYRGKNRFVPAVKYADIQRAKKEFARQEKIMALLMNPYLTREESSGHAKALKKEQQWFAQKKLQYHYEKEKPHARIEDRLECLTNGDAWE